MPMQAFADSIHVVKPTKVKKQNKKEAGIVEYTGKRAYPALFTLMRGEEKKFPVLAKHNQQIVKILFELANDGWVDEGVFRVKFDDDYEANVFREELLCLHNIADSAADCLLAPFHE